PRHHHSHPLFPYTTLFRSLQRAIAMRDPFGAQLAIAIQVAHTQFGEEAIASLHLSNGPLEQSYHFLDLGYHRRKQMGNTIIHDQDRKSTRLNSSHSQISYA